MGYVELSCRWLLGLVFTVALVSKARDPRGFAASVRRLAPLPELPGWVPTRWLPTRLREQPHRSLAGMPAVIVAALEAALVLLLALPAPAAVTCGLALALVLDGAFAVGVLAALRRGERTPCHCFGASEQPLGARHLVRDLVLAGVAALGLLARFSLAGGTHPAGWVLAGFAGALGALVLVLLDDLAGLFLPASLPGSLPGPLPTAKEL